VALDVARILLTPIELLRKTDMAQHAIDALSRSKVRTVRIMGRRGPLQTAFTAKELRELLSISSVDFRPVDESLLPPDVSKLPRQQKRIMQLLMRGSATSLPPSEKSWELRFLRTPTAFLPSGTDNKKLGAVRFEKTRLEEPAFSSDARAVPTGEFEDIPAEIAFRSIGYLSEPLAGFTEAGIPFNGTRGLVPNEDGRVVKPAGDPNALGTPISGVYTSGWVKRGPTGVISNTMYDAFETADAIVNDWVSGNRPFMNQEGGVKWGWEAVEPEVKARGGRPVSWDEWIKIDEAEKERGRKTGKEREKFVNNEEMLAVLE
jgi:adrenodoxin-NADP+ reductase